MKLRKRYLFDIILIVAILAIFLSLLFFVYLRRVEGSTATVTVNGKLFGEYPLSIDAEYTIGEGSNKLKIEDGMAYMSYADCPTGICKKEGKKRFVGQTIVCEPNGVVVVIEGE